MSEKIVEIKNLVKRYGDLLALDHFNLEINQGEIFGLLGPNGSGKTTTINCLLSLLSFDKGEIKLFGEKMAPNKYHLKKEIGVVLQNVAVFEGLTVYENIDYFCGLYINDKKLRKQYVEEAIQFVGLEDYKKMLPPKLSGGLLRRLNIACGIAHKPKLIIMDEPFVGLDPKASHLLKGLMREMCDKGSAIFFSTHVLEVAEQLCDRIIILRKGVKVYEGTLEELKTAYEGKTLEEIFLLIAEA